MVCLVKSENEKLSLASSCVMCGTFFTTVVGCGRVA